MPKYYVVTVREVSAKQFRLHQEGEALPEDYGTTSAAFPALWETSVDSPTPLKAVRIEFEDGQEVWPAGEIQMW